MSQPEQRIEASSAESMAVRRQDTGGDVWVSADEGSPSSPATDQVEGDTTSSSSDGTAPVKYWRFAAMIATSMTAMFALTYANTYRLGDVQ